MPAKPTLVSIPEKEKNPFLRDVERTLNGGVQFGEHGFDLIRETQIIGLSSSIRYKKGPRCRNLDGQYLLLDIADGVIGTFKNGTIPHDLKRIHVGVKVIAMTGVNKTAFPYTLSNVVYALNAQLTDPLTWNDKTIQLSAAKVIASADDCRMIVVIF